MQFLDDFWETIILWLLCGNITYFDDVTGIRILNNTKTHNTIRFEVWVKCGLEFQRKNDPKVFEENKVKIESIKNELVKNLPVCMLITQGDFAFKDIYK